MNFVATVNSFVLANQTAVLFTVAFVLVLVQFAFLAAAFVNEQPLDVENNVETFSDDDALLAYYSHFPFMF